VRNDVAGSAQDGDIFVELDYYNNSLMYQSLITEVGKAYNLTYYYAPRIGVSAASNGIQLYFNSGLLDDVTGDGNVSSDWILRSFTVYGTGSDTIKFVATGTDDSYGGSLDNVSMTPVPEPLSVILVGLGLIGLVGIRRKLQK
jgi:hypothetical protein